MTGRPVVAEQLLFEAGSPGSGRAARLGPASRVLISETNGLDLETFTAEAWVRLDRLPAEGERTAIFDKQAFYGAFVFPNGSLRCSVRGSIAMSPPGAIPAGQWVAVACTGTAATVSTWVNGTLRAEAASMPATGPGVPGMAIGSNMPEGNDVLVGSLDNLRVWSRVLTPAEICASALDCM